jgi:hypothetical protein
LITLPICAEWLGRAVVTWSAKRVTPAACIASFTLNLAALLAKNEDRFCSLNKNNFFIKLVNVLKARQTGVAPSVKLAYVKLLSSFLEHKSGIEWMIACTFWETVFQFSLTDQDERITKESTMFMSKLLETTVDCDENFCDEVVKRIMSPLGENTSRSIKASTDLGDVSDEVASKHLKPALKLIGDILQHFLEGVLLDREDYRVVFSFLQNFHVEERISDFMIIAQSKCLVYDIGKIMFIMQFLELYLQVVTKSGAADTLKASVSRIRNNFVLNLFKGTAEDFIETCNFGQFYWKLTDTKIPTGQVRKTNEPFLFSCQCLLLMLMPQFCLPLRYFSKPISELEEEFSNDVFREAFFQKLLKMVTQDVFRIFYTWRDHFADRSDLFYLSKYVTTLAKESQKYYSRDEAVVLFQIQVYNLKDVMTAIKESPQKLELFLNETDYFCGVFEIVTILINEFDITWRDSFETIDVMALAFDFLTVPNWSTQVVVQALELINVATAKYMTPNLALLVDSTADSTTALLGPLLYVKLLDEAVEVKKAALEVIRTMAKMSNSSKSIRR